MKKLMVVLLFTLFVSGCGDDTVLSPEEQVEQVLMNIEENVELRSMSGVLEHVSESYQDHRGQVKQDIARILQMHFIRNQQINIFTYIRSIDIDEGIASVELSAAMAAKGVDLSQESNRLSADTHRFSVVLSENDGAWLVDSVSWQRGW